MNQAEQGLLEGTKEITKDTNQPSAFNKTKRSLYIGRVKQSEREAFELLVNNSNKYLKVKEDKFSKDDYVF